ncbi:DUF899 family protein [Cupriavidus sp. amp6]|uniref:DUF899 family protein n=1 Tax=Cupriavidus sp. amp6 TaxID=388051 RepID=UPI000420F014|nr:DUF899 family protein [Cupriavidus sp. amp6]
MSHITYPNESAEYRKARNALLEEEIALRRHIEAVAAQRRALPPGGDVPQDYLFERIGATGMPETVAMSRLFGPHPTLILYSFMYGPDRDTPCPMCTLLLDSVNGAARHIGQRAALYIVAKSPIARLVAWARERGWAHPQFLSTAGNSYDADYFGDSTKLPAEIRALSGGKPGEEWDDTAFNVFRLDNGKVRHFWGSDLTWAPSEPGIDHRSGDAVSALWGLLDMTPEGRGQFMPKLAY